jgi:hypothetical protein
MSCFVLRTTVVSFLAIGSMLTSYAQQTNLTPITLKGQQIRHIIAPTSVDQPITFTGLKMGETYDLRIPLSADIAACQPTITAEDPSVVVPADARELRFVAAAEDMTFFLHYNCSWNQDTSLYHSVSLRCASCPVDIKPIDRPEDGIAVNEVGIEEVVREHLVGGDCFDLTGISLCGSPSQVGTFNSGQTSIGFSQGVILATGPISIAEGPNDNDGAGGSGGGCGGDGDLATLTGGSLNDVAKIEFDFTPTQPAMVFEYVFASEEYCEYVGSQFNDVFGFFISGPGITGTQNLAVIPGSGGTAVAINNVNHLTNSSFYVNNQPGSSGNLCGQGASSLPATNELQYDGFTRKFSAAINLIPCQTYHLKLAIADVGDGAWDSAVFLKAGSFDAGGNASVTWVVDGDPEVNEVTESCGQVGLLFERVGGNINVPMTVSFTISGTATVGFDYAPFPSSIVIPAGQEEFFLPVNILSDLLVEGQETIRITLTSLCSCQNPTEILFINDLKPLTSTPDTVTICGGGPVDLTAIYNGGVPDYTFNWSNNGGTEETASFLVGASTTYKVTITDHCGQTTVQFVYVNVRPLPKAQLLPPVPQLCPGGGTATINVNFIGTGPFSFTYSIDGIPQNPIDNITTVPFQLQVSEPGLYQVTNVTDGEGCEGPGQGVMLIVESQLALTGVVTNVQCFGQANGSINTTVSGGQGPYTYNWTGPQNVPSVADPVSLSAGTYVVTVTDGFGCTVSRTFNVQTANVILPTAVQVATPNCYNLNGGALNLTVSGGFPGYSFAWSNGSTAQSPTGLATGTYTVIITDQGGCTRSLTATVNGNITPPVAVGTAMDELDCQTTSITLTAQGSSFGPEYTYLWTPPVGVTLQGSATTFETQANAAGTYILRVTNQQNGCTSTANVNVITNVQYPVAEAGAPQTITCAITTVTLDGTASSTGNNLFTYSWTASNGGVIIGGGNTLQPIVSSIGTYTLVVTNTSNFCTSSDAVVVTANITPPNAVVGPAGQITCTQNTVTLNAGASTPTNVSYSWTTLNGNIISGQSSPSPVVAEAGDYTLVVTNPQNGCTDDATVVVVVNQTVPNVVAVVNGQLNCTVKELVIDATNSTSTGNFSWTASQGGNIVSGANTLTPTVNTPGQYTLLITDPVNNCTASASVQVTQNILPPVAAAGPPATLNCYFPTLVVGDPNTFVLPGMQYQWAFSSGGNIVGAGNQPSAVVNAPGTYTLTVTNLNNGCTNQASVAISQNNTLPTAVVAPAGQINCTTSFVQLDANGTSTGPMFTYQWTTVNGVISAGPTSLTPAVTSEGVYQLLVTNGTNGCTATATTTVVADLNLPDINIAPANPITCAVSQVTISATVNNAGPTPTYQWGTVGGQINSGANTLTPVVGQPGTYTLIATNVSNNCSSVQSVTVPANNAPPAAYAGPTQVLDCNQPTISLNGTGSTGPQFEYNWTTSIGNIVSGANTLTPVINDPGIYTLVVRNTQTGCTSSSSVFIVQDAGQPVIQVAPPTVLNCSVLQTTLNASGSSTGANFQYNWTGPGIVSGANTPVLLVNAPGSYVLQITNNDNGCTKTSTVTVQEDVVLPIADAGPDKTLNCYQPILQINGANMSTGPNFTYQWAGTGIVSGADTPSPVIDAPGTYAVTVTNTSNGCSSEDAVTLDQNFTTPQVDAGPGFVLTCVDNFFQTQPNITGTGPFTYQWSTNGGSFLSPIDVQSPIVNGVGYYYITVTNTISGCTATDQLQVTQSTGFPVADAGVAPILTCATTQISLNGSGSSQNGPFVYEWIPIVGGNIVSGGNTLYPVVNEPGTYRLLVRDTSNSCISNSQVTVNQNITPPTVDAGIPVTLTCSVSSLNLNGTVSSSGNFTYQWSASGGGNITSGANTPSPTVNAVGLYTLTVTNTVNGCTNTDNVSVLADQNAPVVAIAEPAVLNCINSFITLNASGTSTGNVSYTWSTPNGSFLSLSDTLAPIIGSPGLYQLLVLNLDNNCASLAAVNVTQDIAQPQVIAGADSELDCNTIITTLDGSASNSTGNYFIQWTTPNGEILAGANSFTPTVSAAGTYLLTVLNTDNGCSASDIAVVTIDVAQPVVTVLTPALLTCFSPEVILDGSPSSNGPNFSYAWTTPNGNITSGANSLQVLVDAPGSYTFTIQNNNNGCANSSTILVDQNTVAPSVQIIPPQILTCSNPLVTITALAEVGSQYVFGWSTFDGNIVSGSNTLNLKVDEPGSYSILVVNNLNGCASLANTAVTEITDRPESFDYSLELPGCRDNDGSIRFNTVSGGIGPYLYSLDGGETFSTTVAFGNVAPGNYELVVQDVNGCEYLEDLEVPPAVDPAVDVTPQFNLVLGDSTRLNAVLPPNYPLYLIDTILWRPLDYLTFDGNSIEDLLNPLCKPLHTIRYEVKIISRNGGCQALDRVLVSVDSEPRVYIPNVFYPDDPANANHLFLIYADDQREQIRKITSFQVYDRWGERVHEAYNFKPNDPSYGWNGKIGGTGDTMAPAVFVYYAEIELIDGRKILYEGDVTLIR